jgi:lipid-A-disaccharide synthase
LKLLLVAGEVSGDQHAGALLAALRARVPSLAAFGVGGEDCGGQGMRLVAHQKDLAVVGLVEALSKLRFARRLIRTLVAEAAAEKADAAVLIDSPDFNLPLARRLTKAGIPVVFYVSPQVWAWRSARAGAIARLGRAVLVLFRFEKSWWDARGLGERVTWVGHPLVDRAALELGTPPPPPSAGVPRVVLMPGSRAGEIRRNLPVLRDAVALLRARHPGLEVALVQADSIPRALLEEVAGPDLSSWRVVSGPHLALLAAAGVVLVASGTATVEGLLAGVPMVVVYRVHPLTFWLARRIVKVPFVAMANLLSDDGSGTGAVPELLQNDATPERVAAAASAFLEDEGLASRTRARLARGREELGPPGAPGRTADALLAALADRGPAGAGSPA